MLETSELSNNKLFNNITLFSISRRKDVVSYGKQAQMI